MKFLNEFFTDWRTVGAVAPTSRFTQSVMLDAIDWRNARIVLELGAGTGAITRSILSRMHPAAKLLAVELNERFVLQLRRSIKDERLEVVHGSATDLDAILNSRSLPRADGIVSSIPFASLPFPLRQDICKASATALASGGRFVALQYTPLVLPPLLRKHFGRYSVRGSLLNVPPALIYTCVRTA